MSNLICWCLSKSHCPPRGSWARHPLALFTELETFALHFGCGGGLCTHLTMPVWLPCFNHWSSAHHGLLSRNFQCDLPVLRWTLKLLLLLVSVMLADFNWYRTGSLQWTISHSKKAHNFWPSFIPVTSFPFYCSKLLNSRASPRL